MKHPKLYGKVFTTSNYRGLNDQWLEVNEFLGQMVAMKVYNPVTGEETTADFTLKEVVEYRHEKPKTIIGNLNEEDIK